MREKGISREMLKCIACATMLLDHIGAVFLPGAGLRIIGRVSFPIFCFLLAEGARFTRSPARYALRLALVALLCEIPYDLLFYGGITWRHQSVMLTLLVGLGVCLAMNRSGRLGILALGLGCLLAEWLSGDYGGFGVALMALFFVSAGHKWKDWLRLFGMAVIFLLMGSPAVPGLVIPIQLFGLLAMVPIALYSGRKTTASRAVQWAFYMFYPAHLAVLLLMVML